MNASMIIIAICAGLVAMATVNGQGASSDDSTKCQMNGQSYAVGSMFDGTDAFYFCKKGGVAEAIGCISNGQRVYDLALYQKDSNYYRCRAGDSSVSSDLWGCAYTGPDGTVQPKSIACTWDVGSDPSINYVASCVAKGGTAVVTQMYCLYTYQGGRIQINEGCYRVFPDVGVAAGCKRNPDGTTLTLKTWSSKSAATDPQAAGMFECPITSK
jgi:hypothetical protein